MNFCTATVEGPLGHEYVEANLLTAVCIADMDEAGIKGCITGVTVVFLNYRSFVCGR
jgi:hypothetical protein